VWPLVIVSALTSAGSALGCITGAALERHALSPRHEAG
jgi:hypothetical protein